MTRLTELKPSLLGVFCGSVSPLMRTVDRAVFEVAPTEFPIFITGESGTGKGTLATMIHRLSTRSKLDLVKVNCQTLPAAFDVTDNGSLSPLCLTEHQSQGTILLDEVLELPAVWQTRLMALLPEGDIDSAGMRKLPRVIAVTRSNDGKLQSDSQFSRELYYRLRGVVLRIPPLRERREDIPLLSHFFIKKYAASFGRSAVQLSARAQEQFQQYPWPGNVRELENTIKTLLAVDDEELVLQAIGLSHPESATIEYQVQITPPQGKLSLKETARIASRIAEKQRISEVLRWTRWNRKRAAKELNISYKALLYKLKQNGLSGPSAVESKAFRSERTSEKP